MHQSTLQTVSGIPGAAAGIEPLLDAALDCIVTMDARGDVVGWNRAAEETFGYRREEAIGRPLGELIVPEPLREAHARGLSRYLAGGDPPILGRRIELTACRADGTELPVELTITRVEGEPPSSPATCATSAAAASSSASSSCAWSSSRPSRRSASTPCAPRCPT